MFEFDFPGNIFTMRMVSLAKSIGWWQKGCSLSSLVIPGEDAWSATVPPRQVDVADFWAVTPQPTALAKG